MNNELINKLFELSKKHSSQLNLIKQYYELSLVKRKSLKSKYSEVIGYKLFDNLIRPCISELISNNNLQYNNSRIPQTKNLKGFRYNVNHYYRLPLNSNTTIVQFKFMYPNIILNLYDSNLIKFNNESYGSVVTELIRNIPKIKDMVSKEIIYTSIEGYLFDRFKSNKVWYLTKILVNSLYSELKNTSTSTFNITNLELVPRYCDNVFEELIKELGGSIQVIDINRIYISDYDNIDIKLHNILDKLDLPYEIVLK